LLIISNFALFHFYEVQLSHEQQKTEYAFMTHQFKIQAEYYKKLVEEHQAINKTTHDSKNNLLAIKGCLLGGDIQGALRKINEIYANLTDATKIYTSNITVDTILNAKEKEARNAGLKLQILTSSFEDINVDAIDLSVILGNALDNAIEACMKIPEYKTREILAKILRIDDYISIVIENTVDKPVQILNGMVASTKQNSFHGYGIKNIMAIVQKYDGDVQLQYEAYKFSISMLLCAK
jgi:sensor histidine kinase regulating citrate/malate metabolism